VPIYMIAINGTTLTCIDRYVNRHFHRSEPCQANSHEYLTLVCFK
jgi:hypothetical protein